MKPWEMNWNEQVNPQDYNGSYLQSTDGSDAKPFEKLNLFLRDFGAEARPSDKTFGELASGFFKNIGTFEIKKAQRTPEQQQRIDTISKAFEGELDTGEVAKGFARGTLELSKGTGGLVKMLGDWWRDEQDSTNLLPSEIKRLKYNNFGADALVKTGQWIQDLSDMGLESDLLQQDPETFKGSFTENPSLTRTLSTVASGIPSLAYGWGMSKLTNPVLGVSLMSGVDTQDMYWEAKEAGKSKAEAGAIFTVATAGTYAFEKIGFDSIFEKKVTPLAVKITGSMITEGLTEGGQTLYQNLVKKIGYDETQNMFEGVVESIVAGAGSGGLASAAVGVSNKLTRAETVLKNQGYSDNDISVMEEAIGNEMIAHKDTIEPMLQENITKSINNLNTLKEKFAGLPEQTRQQISRELEEIYGTVRNKLKGVVDDVEADSIAKLQQGRALYMYEATGMMPSEYAKKMPEIRRAENIEQANFDEMFFQESYDAQGKADINTSEFKNWFGDSKTVDEQGKPISLYRGDVVDIEVFDEKRQRGGNLGRAFYFTTDEGYAKQYSDFEKTGREPKQYYLRIENPLYVGKEGYIRAILNKFPDAKNLNTQQAIKEFLMQKGIDGVIWDRKDRIEYAVYKPNQIKSVYNRGTFSRESDNVYYQGSEVRQYNPREDIPNVRGGWTKNKILKYLKANGSLRGVGTATRMIAEFDSVEELKEHMFYHGAKYGTSGRMKPSITMSDREVENVGGGGYGDKYWAISLSKSKKVAGNFATASGNGSIYPVLLVKNAKVIEMPELDDSADLEDHIEQLYTDGVDAVWIGDKDSGEQELAVINPKAIVNIGTSEFYRAYKLGRPENPINIRSDEEIQKIFDYAKDFVREYPKSAPDEEIDRARNIVYWQPAFHGTPHPELEGGSFKLEKIGTGENAQAHGYGLYFTASYDVADKRYRERLTKPYTWFISFGEVEFDKKTGKYKNAFNETTLEFEVYKDFKLDAGEDIDVLLKSYEQTRFFDNRTDEKIAIVNKYKDYFVNNDVHNFSDESMATGQVYEVDLPENPYLLDEQKTLDEQSEFVKEQLNKVFDDVDVKPNELVKLTGSASNPYKNVAKYKTGREIYKDLSTILKSDKAASQILEKYGVKGITYFGQQDGRCFVIFNPEDVKVIQKFYQNESSPYGAYSNNVIYLFQKANRSTLAHELAHSWHNELLSMQEYDKIKQDLETFDKWSENEFNRKYKIEKRANGYAVVNKQGNVVYDKSGSGFVSEQDAKDYAKEELFARGFEEYLREGKAPSNALKQAFRNFLMWLKKLYKDAMALNIELSPDMKNFYADILGGADLDFFLNSTPETFIENRVKLGQERETELDTIISDAQNDKTQKVKSKTGKRLKDIWVTSMIPLSTRAKRVSPKLRTRLRRYEFDLLTNLRDRYNKALPFLNIWKTMSENDAIAFDLALKNDYVAKQLEIVDKYNARKEWESVRELLTSIYDDAINAGLDLNYRPDYFPRRVKDVDGFLSYLRNSPEWTRFEEAIRDADPYNTFTVEEKADFLNKYLRGFVRVDLLPNKYSSEKKRKIDIINNEMNKFYADSSESLIMYIEGMNKRIESAKFLGKVSDNYDESIGGYLTYLLDNNIIDPKKVDEVRDILSARFNERGVSNLGLKSLRDVSYMYTMGGINSAITQIDDLSTSMYKAGIWNTLSTALSSKRITRKDLGLDVVSDEFRDSAATAKALNKLFKLTGLDAIDGFAKETLVNAVIKKYRQYSDETLREVIEPIMEEDTGQTIEDIRNNDITDNVLFLVFNDLSDVQPISKSELPAFYNTSGNLRILYMLKSFMIKRIDIFRNECFDKIKDPKTRVQGVQNLVRLAVLMMLMGASKDVLIDLLYGRDVEISETMVNNALGLAGISKFQVYQAKEKGFTGVIKDLTVPPIFAIYDDLINDISKVSEGKRELKNLEVLKGIPLVGRFYYWWVGRGKEKLEKRNKKTY